jgi:hypothetical protein
MRTLPEWVAAYRRFRETGIDMDGNGPWKPGMRVYRETEREFYELVGKAYLELVTTARPKQSREKSNGSLLDLYKRVMNDSIDFTQGTFTVRIWDGMDGCWTDVGEATNVSADKALEVWNERTKGGTEKIRFDEIDYYRIFPADTYMK